jgi:hypothetical protein
MRQAKRIASRSKKLQDVVAEEKQKHPDAAIESDAPRCGAPGKFTPEQVCAIIALACEDSKDIVCDNLTHVSEGVVRLVARLCGVDEELGKKGKSGHLRNRAPREAFLHDTTHRICFSFTPKHTSWLNQIR